MCLVCLVCNAVVQLCVVKTKVLRIKGSVIDDLIDRLNSNMRRYRTGRF